MKERQIYALVQQTPEGGADLSALLHARKLQGCRISAVAVNAERALRHALASGCDQAILIQTNREPSASERACALAAYLKNQTYDLIIASAFQADEEALVSHMILFERLGLPAVYGADRIERMRSKESDSLIVRKAGQETVETSRIAFPAAISVTWKKNPDGTHVGQLLDAYRKPIETVQISLDGNSDFVREESVPFGETPASAPEKVPPEEAACRILQAVLEVRG